MLVAYAVSWAITAISEASLCCTHGWLYRILHISIGGICLLVVAACVYIKEKTLVDFMLGALARKKKKKRGVMIDALGSLGVNSPKSGEKDS